MMKVNKIYQGDALSVLQTFPDNSIDMCMTSPPYWGLRDYGVEQIFSDGWKGQLGLEPTPEMYIQHMTEIFHEVKRVLKKEGTLWLVIGDTYGGSCQGGGDTGISKERYRKELLTYKDTPQKKMMPKCLMMIPERLAWSMIQDGWILRNKNIWYKHNGMPSSVHDRFSNKYEFVYMFSQAQKYYFNLDAVREAHLTKEPIGYERNIGGKSRSATIQPRSKTALVTYGEGGKNPGDVFEINTQPFPEAHFAVYPVKLCEKPIKAGCPKEVCVKCGKARERIIKKGKSLWQLNKDIPAKNYPMKNDNYKRSGREYWRNKENHPDKFIGWTKCGCNAGFKPGVVLDPFSGAGTTCYTAVKLGRDFIGIEIGEKYKAMSEDRIFGSLFKPTE